MKVELKELENREVIYDFIRVTACLCVIGIHCAGFLVNATIGNSIWWVGTIIQAIVRIGLPMFTLLSGVLILNSNEEKVSKFYLKRFIKIVIPLYIYSFFYIYAFNYNYSLKIFRLPNLLNVIKDITREPSCYHLWYVYMIIGIYLCTPYIKKMCKSLNDNECKNLMILIFIISIIKYLLPSIGINIGLTNIIFVDWTLIFILGYLVTRDCISKNYKTIYALGIVSFIFYLIAKRWFVNITNLDDLSITMMFEVMAIYLFFYRNREKICSNKKINNIVMSISKYSWEIYLIHVLPLIYIRHLVIGKGPNIVCDSIILTVLVTLASFYMAYIIHNVIVKNVQKLMKKLIDIFSKIKIKEIIKNNIKQ